MPTISRGLYRWVFHGGAIIEDFADRLSHFWTFGLLLLLAAVTGMRQGLWEPIHCWTPVEFTDNMVAWTASHCWNSHFIQLPKHRYKAEEILFPDSPRSERNFDIPVVSFEFPDEPTLMTLYSTTTTLYQWIPLIFFFQALAFKFPSIFLYLIHGYSGLSFDKLKGLTYGYENLNMHERNILCRKISRYMYDWCNQLCIVSPWRFLTGAWLMTKILYCFNIGMQLGQIDYYIRTTHPPFDNSTSYADVITGNLFANNGSAWKTSPVFPRQVVCDFIVRKFANKNNHYTVTCDLPMNELTEVALMFLWVWFLIVTTVTGLSLVTWLMRIFIPMFRQRYISRLLRINEDLSGLHSFEVSRFASWVGEDGVMALKIISSNSSELVASDVLYDMWKRRQHETGTSNHGQVGYTLVPQGPSPMPMHQGSMQAGPMLPSVASAPAQQPSQSSPPMYPGLDDTETKI